MNTSCFMFCSTFLESFVFLFFFILSITRRSVFQSSRRNNFEPRVLTYKNNQQDFLSPNHPQPVLYTTVPASIFAQLSTNSIWSHMFHRGLWQQTMHQANPSPQLAQDQLPSPDNKPNPTSRPPDRVVFSPT